MVGPTISDSPRRDNPQGLWVGFGSIRLVARPSLWSSTPANDSVPHSAPGLLLMRPTVAGRHGKPKIHLFLERVHLGNLDLDFVAQPNDAARAPANKAVALRI